MSLYRCKIGTSDGRVLEKEFDAVSPETLRENLEEQGFFVFKIQKKPLQWLSGSAAGGRLNSRRFLSLNQEMQVLIRSGLPILEVLDTLVDRMEPGRLMSALQEVRADVKGGSILSEAFGRFPGMFPQLFIASLRAGEQSGDLPETLGRYIDYQKRVEAIKAKVRSAMVYPSILAVFVILVLAVMMFYVIPNFTLIYADADVDLPILTQFLIITADGLVNLLPIWLPLLIVGIFILRTYLKSDKGAFFLDRFKLRIPFFGALLSEYALSTFSRTLATTTDSGLPIVQAMQMSRGTLNNRYVEQHLSSAIQKVQEGAKISEALEQTGDFPVIALRMISVGESSGSLVDMLTDVSEYYEAEIERRLDRLTTTIEPLMMMIMAVVIAIIVVALYLPIFQMAGTLQ